MGGYGTGSRGHATGKGGKRTKGVGKELFRKGDLAYMDEINWGKTISRTKGKRSLR